MKATKEQIKEVALSLFCSVSWGPSPTHERWDSMQPHNKKHWYRHARAAIAAWEKVRKAKGKR